MTKRNEAKEYLRGAGLLEQKLIDVAYGRRWGSKPILIPLHKALKILKEAKKDLLRTETNIVDWLSKWFGEEQFGDEQ